MPTQMVPGQDYQAGYDLNSCIHKALDDSTAFFRFSYLQKGITKFVDILLLALVVDWILKHSRKPLGVLCSGLAIRFPTLIKLHLYRSSN